MNVLVIGSNGLLGSNVVRDATSREWTAVGTYHSREPNIAIERHELDIRATDRFDGIVRRVRPDAVVNCAAMTDVDGCEHHPERAHEVNGTAPGELATVAAEYDVSFVHVSTDYVFDGTRRLPYDERSAPGPKQTYGESKLAGERAVAKASPSSLVARLSFVYGIHRSSGELAGFPRWVRERLEAGETTPLFTDQYVSPSRAGQAATTILDLLAHDVSGTFNVACRSCVTPYEFGKNIANRTGLPPWLLEAGSMDDVDRPAVRPRHTCLATDRVKRVLERPQPSLDSDLDALF